MRWLQNISFSSTSSTSSSGSSPKPTSTSAEEPFSPTKRYASRTNPRGALRLAGPGVFGARLTRQRKLRHLGENEMARSSKSECVDNVVLSRSPSCSSSLYTQSSRLSTSVPLPLPLPLPGSSNSGDDCLRFPSPKDRESVRDKTDGGADGGSSYNLSPISRDARRAMEQGEMRPHRNVPPQDMNNVDKSREKFRLNVPTRSAPTSPFSSPVLSPHQTSNVVDLLPYYHMVAKGNQVWSAPEMATLDIPGLPPPAFFDFSAFSTESSPLHSPPNISPRWNARSNTSGPPSPLTTKMSIESSTTRRDSNATIEVHPLPLPPGAALSSPTCSVPQVMGKPESTRMKSQWQKGKLIGRGTFGSVYVASNRETGALCAMKEVELLPDDPKSAECMKQLEQEIKVLSKLKHPNIVQYYGSEIVDERFYIYLEYVHPGSINKYAREHCGAITESVVRSFTRHIVSGLAYLHSMKTIHRDIKGANLLVDASGVVKLADFGMAKHLSGQVADLSLKGSPYWMAPELLQAVMQKDTNSDLALAIDIWSLGCTIIEMFNGKPPWSEYEGAAAMFKVLRDTPPIPDTLSPEGKDFLRCCFKRNPAERPSASMLLEHRWLRNSQLDFSSSGPSTTVAKLTTDMSYSPRTSEVKLEQWPIFSSSQSTKGKLASESSGFAPYTFSSARMSNDLVMRLPT